MKLHFSSRVPDNFLNTNDCIGLKEINSVIGQRKACVHFICGEKGNRDGIKEWTENLPHIPTHTHTWCTISIHRWNTLMVHRMDDHQVLLLHLIVCCEFSSNAFPMVCVAIVKLAVTYRRCSVAVPFFPIHVYSYRINGSSTSNQSCN